LVAPLKGATSYLQHLRNFFNFKLNWLQNGFSRIQDGVSLKSKNNARHHNTKPILII
jgi:hypothetical protein